MSKATVNALSELHGALAREMKRILENGVVNEDGERETPGASHLNVIRQFLKDNHIDTAPGNADMTALANAANGPKLPFPTQTDDEFGLPN